MTKEEKQALKEQKAAEKAAKKEATKNKPIYKKWWFWLIIVVVIIAIIPKGKSDDTNKTETTAAVKEETTAAVKEETTTAAEEIKYTVSVNPKVNDEDGTVLFEVKTNMPESTKFNVKVSDGKGYEKTDTATILNNGSGFTAEFDDNGKGLNGHYTVEVSNDELNEKFEYDFEWNNIQGSIGELNALAKAESYLSFSGFSKKGLKEQLEFEGFTSDEAQFGVDNCGADWNEQAVRKAESYIDLSGFSKKGLKEQLEFEGFTSEEAEYGVENITVDWNEQAGRKAESYMDLSSFSKSALIDQLKFEGFTSEEAEYGATVVGY